MTKPYYDEEGHVAVKNEIKPTKKQIFLIGDSIRMGYCQTVKEELEEIANVFYPEENCRDSHYVITSLRAWFKYCNPDDVDIIHFNFGHWDVAHWNGYKTSLTSLREYKKNLICAITLMRLLYKNAKLVFATSTPMNPKSSCGVNPRTTKEFIRYNNVAKSVCKKYGVLVDDLFEFTKNCDSSAFSDYAHFTKEKFAEIGAEVARYLKPLI